MSDPKDDKIINGARGDDNWAPGERTDGSIDIFDPAELATRRDERDAYEAEFDKDVGDDSD